MYNTIVCVSSIASQVGKETYSLQKLEQRVNIRRLVREWITHVRQFGEYILHLKVYRMCIEFLLKKISLNKRQQKIATT